MKREIIETNKTSTHGRISDIELKISRNQQNVKLIKFLVERPCSCEFAPQTVELGDLFSPFLEQSHALTAAIGAPEVAAARRVVTAAVRPVVAVRRSTDAGAPKNSNEGRPSNRN